MRFSFIFTVLAFVFSVNAAALDKRNAFTCANSLTAISTQLSVLANAITSYTASQGYGGALAIQSQEKNLESKITSASDSSACCIGGYVSEADALSIIEKVDPLTTQIEALAATIVAKKPDFDSVPLVTSLVKGDISSLNIKTSTLSSCLLVDSPPSLVSTMQGYIDRINAALAAATAAYA